MAPCQLCPPEAPNRAILRRPKTLQPVCKDCFFLVFETEIHHTIMGYGQAEQLPDKASRARNGAGKGKEKEEAHNSDSHGSLSNGAGTGATPAAATATPRRKHLFKRGEKVAIGASGGKGPSQPLGCNRHFATERTLFADSTVLAYVMKLLNERYDYGLDLCLLSIDEGISGYRDASLDVRLT
jgi:cytoplasmic tRNA 2-thiolation protein 1